MWKAAFKNIKLYGLLWSNPILDLLPGKYYKVYVDKTLGVFRVENTLCREHALGVFCVENFSFLNLEEVC